MKVRHEKGEGDTLRAQVIIIVSQIIAQISNASLLSFTLCTCILKGIFAKAHFFLYKQAKVLRSLKLLSQITWGFEKGKLGGFVSHFFRSLIFDNFIFNGYNFELLL